MPTMVSAVRKNKWRILSATFLLKHLSKNKHFQNKKASVRLYMLALFIFHQN